MKQIVLAAMIMMTMAGSVNAGSGSWDHFWGTVVSRSLDPKTSGWDEFWGTEVPAAFDPKLNGWDEFWYQCQDPNKTAGDCTGTVFAGIGLAIALPVIALTASNIIGNLVFINSPLGLMAIGPAA